VPDVFTPQSKVRDVLEGLGDRGRQALRRHGYDVGEGFVDVLSQYQTLEHAARTERLRDLDGREHALAEREAEVGRTAQANAWHEQQFQSRLQQLAQREAEVQAREANDATDNVGVVGAATGGFGASESCRGERLVRVSLWLFCPPVNVAVVDVSEANNWSAVRVQLGHGSEFGSVYPTYGFIYDRPDNGTLVANTDVMPAPTLNPPAADLRPARERVLVSLGHDADEEVAEAADDTQARTRHAAYGRARFGKAPHGGTVRHIAAHWQPAARGRVPGAAIATTEAR